MARYGNETTDLMKSRPHAFDITSWSLIRRAHDGRALNKLFSIYWKPLYFFVRQKGYSNDEAKDVVQEFLKGFHERRAVLRADPARGKFRTFLLTAIANFMVNWEKASHTLKRGRGKVALETELQDPESDYQHCAARGETPDESIDRAWARNLWEQCLGELRGEPVHLEAFRLRTAGVSYEEIAKKTGVSVSALKSAVDRLRAQLRDTVVGYLRPGLKNDQELRAEILRFKALVV